MIASPPVIHLTRPRKHVTLKRLSFDHLLLKRNCCFLLTCIEYLAHDMLVSLKVDDTTYETHFFIHVYKWLKKKLYMYININTSSKKIYT